jgi:hypothetical protein
VQNVYISLAVAFALMALTLLVLKLMQKNKATV